MFKVVVRNSKPWTFGIERDGVDLGETYTGINAAFERLAALRNEEANQRTGYTLRSPFKRRGNATRRMEEEGRIDYQRQQQSAAVCDHAALL